MDPITLIVALLMVYVIIRVWPIILALCVGWLAWNIFVLMVNAIFIVPGGGTFL
jgi:c-di-AMP phosphodiesterase-like protein